MHTRITKIFIVIALVLGFILSRVGHWLKRQSSGPAPKPILLHYGPMRLMQTNSEQLPEQRLEQQTVDVYWRFSGTNTKEVISVHPEISFQEIVGFGGAFTDAACYNFDLLTEDDRAKLFSDLFNPASKGGLGLNFCRVCIGSSDYATHVYSYDEGEPDPELKRFSIAHDQKYILPCLRQALALNSEMLFYGSPWSPPGWMKSNGSMLGGSFQRKNFGSYANYFVKFIDSYKAEGINIYAITVQNEVDTDQDGKMPACLWPQEYEVDFVSYHLGPLFEKLGLETQIWIIDHNYNLWGRAVASLETPALAKYASAIAWHGYVGDAWRISTVHDAHPKIDHYWTEGGPDYTDPNYQSDYIKWARTFTTNLSHWCRGITVWNLALDQTGRPNIGPFPCGGLVTINSITKEVTRSGQYYALAHFSKFIERGAKRIESKALKTTQEISHIAFLNPSGERVLVLTNLGPEKTISIEEGKSVAEITLTKESVTTLAWQ
ncbi:MAG: glycoside hydrolase family 30 beta sandwich domain-containing protein [Candidatus Obscuribacterales bacterium]